MMRPTRLRHLYDVAALVALLNMIALGAVTGYAWSTGVLDGAKFQQVLKVVRGEAGAATAAESDAASESEEPPMMVAPLPIVPADLEIMRHEAERMQEELRQRLALNNSILLQVTAEREAFKKEQDEAAERQSLANKKRKNDEQVAETGLTKQIEIYEELAPKVAAQHLLSIEDLDDAARILIGMDPRKSRKIIEAAKRGEQIQQMTMILQRMREVAPARATELSTIEP